MEELGRHLEAGGAREVELLRALAQFRVVLGARHQRPRQKQFGDGRVLSLVPCGLLLLLLLLLLLFVVVVVVVIVVAVVGAAVVVVLVW